MSNRIYINKNMTGDGWWDLLINSSNVSAHRIAKEFKQYQIEKIFVDNDSVELYREIKPKIKLAICASLRYSESFYVYKRVYDDFSKEFIETISVDCISML